jgi:hypothetical protein
MPLSSHKLNASSSSHSVLLSPSPLLQSVTLSPPGVEGEADEKEEEETEEE